MTERRTRPYSPAQRAYLAAKISFDVADRDYLANNELMDAEGARLGLATPFCVLPDGHPMRAEAQRLLDRRCERLDAMRDASNALFDWALETVFVKTAPGSRQKNAISSAVARVKNMAHVEAFHREMVDICMKLEA